LRLGLSFFFLEIPLRVLLLSCHDFGRRAVGGVLVAVAEMWS
jgi:hypothetical protein